jgi:hypothetical protein
MAGGGIVVFPDFGMVHRCMFLAAAGFTQTSPVRTCPRILDLAQRTYTCFKMRNGVRFSIAASIATAGVHFHLRCWLFSLGLH